MAKDLEKTSQSLFDSTWNEIKPSGGTQNVDELASKHISALAVISTAIALLSILAFVYVGFVAASALAVLVAVWAFIVIARSGGEITGRKFACIGLALGLCSLIGAPVSSTAYRMDFERQADEFCKVWFQLAKDGKIADLRQLTSPYWNRATFVTHKDEVDLFVRQMQGDEEPHYNVHSFLANPTLLTLNALGERAHISFYKTKATIINQNLESTGRIYAVTVEPSNPNDVKQTFFITLYCDRRYNKTEEGEKLVGWIVHDADVNPMELGADGRPVWEEER